MLRGGGEYIYFTPVRIVLFGRVAQDFQKLPYYGPAARSPSRALVTMLAVPCVNIDSHRNRFIPKYNEID